MTNIVEHLHWCCVHGSQEDAIAAMTDAAAVIAGILEKGMDDLTMVAAFQVNERLRAEIERLRAHNKVLCDNQHDHVRYCTRIHEQEAEIERLTAQLPDGMKHCTIRFIECEKGHGRLTAANWVDTGCQSCEIERLRDEIEGLRADLMIAGGKFAEVMDENERLRAALLMPLSSDELRLVDKNCDWIAFKHAWNAIMKRRALEPKP